MTVELVLLICGEVESVEGVFDARGVEGVGLGVEGAEGGVDASRLLLRLGGFAFGFRREGGFFFAEKSFFFGLLARGFGGLFSSSFTTRMLACCAIQSRMAYARLCI